MPSPFNTFQAAVAAKYGHGDYAHFIKTGVTESALNKCGDTLFVFLMRELAGTTTNPMDKETAEQRLRGAIQDCEAALRNVEAIEEV